MRLPFTLSSLFFNPPVQINMLLVESHVTKSDWTQDAPPGCEHSILLLKFFFSSSHYLLADSDGAGKTKLQAELANKKAASLITC